MDCIVIDMCKRISHKKWMQAFMLMDICNRSLRYFSQCDIDFCNTSMIDTLSNINILMYIIFNAQYIVIFYHSMFYV